MECFNIRLKPTTVVINYNFKYFFKEGGLMKAKMSRACEHPNAAPGPGWPRVRRNPASNPPPLPHYH